MRTGPLNEVVVPMIVVVVVVIGAGTAEAMVGEAWLETPEERLERGGGVAGR